MMATVGISAGARVRFAAGHLRSLSGSARGMTAGPAVETAARGAGGREDALARRPGIRRGGDEHGRT
jgi:hypothetical protein